MALRALLLTHDPDAARTLRRVLNDLGIKIEECTNAERAAEWVDRRKFDVAIIDVDGAPGAAALLDEIRQSSSNRTTVIFAILNGTTTPQQAFNMGANLALQKPLSMDRAVRSFRAAHVLVMGECRHFYRHRVDMPVTITMGQTEIQATGTDVSEGGMAVRVQQPVPAGSTVQLRFMLPGGKAWIGTAAAVAWADEEGLAGLKFENFPDAARQEFERWAAQHSNPQSALSPAVIPAAATA